MKKILYNAIGKDYNRNRTSDSRISNTILKLLDIKESDLIADIGAGTGNYIKKSENSYPPTHRVVEELERIFDNEVSIIPFQIPFDIKGGFFYASWQKPEKYLEADFRNSISVFAKFAENVVVNFK